MKRSFSYEVFGVEELKQELQTKTSEAVKLALTETMEDLRRCASGFAPKDTGHLESSGRIEIKTESNQIIGECAFEVTADQENYAIIMHEGMYNLGPKSRSKGGGSSKFGMVSHTVGRKYLETPFHQLLPAYIEHIATVISSKLN